ncbi:MAG: UDP-N-acetylmuramate dehydrogenase, partial [Suipraeoptans sp.]
GYRGLIIETHENFKDVNIEGNIITAYAGASLTRIAHKAMDAGLSGFEFASGIPGTFGGACIMNAGAYGGEMKHVLVSARALTQDGTVVSIDKQDMDLGYRSSVFSKKGYIVLEGKIELKEGKRTDIKSRMDDLSFQRSSKQPLEYPSAGSTFKRPEGYFAGKLIQDSGLSGVCVGGAMVSTKHNGFVINADNATTTDVVNLMNKVIQTVNEKFGVTLEPEVKRIGEF